MNTRDAPGDRARARAILAVLPRVRPAGWLRTPDVVAPTGDVLVCFARARDGLRAVVSVDTCSPRVRWLHVSVSYPDRLPGWEALKDAKAAFIGDVLAVQVMPKTADYVNVHPYALHLWHNLAGPTLPDEDDDHG
jgi:hypothetical protein